jgi:hypothetical protein
MDLTCSRFWSFKAVFRSFVYSCGALLLVSSFFGGLRPGFGEFFVACLCRLPEAGLSEVATFRFEGSFRLALEGSPMPPIAFFCNLPRFLL